MSEPIAHSFSGALRIIRFNWPSYLAALVAALALGLGALMVESSGLRIGAAIGAGLVAWGALSSIAASHWIYDRSPLTRWIWIEEWLRPAPRRWLIVETGFDATGGAIHRLFPGGELRVVDLFGLEGVGGESVRRARRENAPDPTIGRVTSIPDEPDSLDAVVAIFALHEVRASTARERVFSGIARALAPGGRLLIVEHLRDARNFAVFGPGFLHFLPESEWSRCASRAGLQLEQSRSMTPFVRVFSWRRP